MKSLCLVVLIACVCGQAIGFNLRQFKRSIDVPFTCVPGESYSIECNSCICDSTGKAGICTLKYCSKSEGESLKKEERPKRDLDVRLEYECEPRSSFKDDCNLCICSETGEYAICTATACVPGLDFGARFNKVTKQ